MAINPQVTRLESGDSATVVKEVTKVADESPGITEKERHWRSNNRVEGQAERRAGVVAAR
ncbi:hypothetical protein GCM10010468_48540 [Actinocorallia longicatena]|uniref:FXSXX-COOH protein n=1 Tax=Actinocorallia longicatena TaxID=111803 RepID=A0ABP6QH83_9ACTN